VLVGLILFLGQMVFREHSASMIGRSEMGPNPYAAANAQAVSVERAVNLSITFPVSLARFTSRWLSLSVRRRRRVTNCMKRLHLIEIEDQDWCPRHGSGRGHRLSSVRLGGGEAPTRPSFHFWPPHSSAPAHGMFSTCVQAQPGRGLGCTLAWPRGSERVGLPD